MQDANVWQKRKRISRLAARRGQRLASVSPEVKLPCAAARASGHFYPADRSQTSDNSGVVIAPATFLTQLRPEET
jgi:hypothetical protein